jgi:hypothetical protein
MHSKFCLRLFSPLLNVRMLKYFGIFLSFDMKTVILVSFVSLLAYSTRTVIFCLRLNLLFCPHLLHCHLKKLWALMSFQRFAKKKKK